MNQYKATDYIRGSARARQAGDIEAAEYLSGLAKTAQAEEDQAQYNPTSGMSGTQKTLANVGAGMERFGVGLAQLLLPKSAERGIGITDDSILERRQRDEVLADSQSGGRLIQALGEAAPTLAIPGGAIAKALRLVPKAAQAGQTLSVGNRIANATGIGRGVLPTATAEGAVMGGIGGAITPTTSEEGSGLNALAGALTGGAAPGVMTGLGAVSRKALQPVFQSVQRGSLARQLGKEIDTSPAAQSNLEQKIAESASRGIDAPQSLATLTQDPATAQLELAARSNPQTSKGWLDFDELGRDARWKALNEALGSEETVNAAKAATDSYAKTAIPAVMQSVDKARLTTELGKFRQSLGAKLDTAVKEADPARQEVYSYVTDALDKGGGSAQMLWNIRKTLKGWMEGAPPPGKEGTRGAKMDVPLRDVTEAIDSTLNLATGDEWGKFLRGYAGFARKEGSQKAGQNIRNAFMDETLLTPRGATTRQGSPAVTRAKLEQALVKFGKNEFGETLDPTQRKAIDAVLNDLRGEEILDRVKSSMTGKGGSQTAPLNALMKRTGTRLSGGWVSDLAGMFSQLSAGKQREMLNTILQSPSDALALMRQAEKLRGPLSRAEQRLVYAARSMLASPSMLVGINQQADTTSEAPRE